MQLAQRTKPTAGNEWLVFACIGIAAFILGMVGIREYELNYPAERSPTWLDQAYSVTQFYVLNGQPLAHEAPSALQIARFVAPLTTLLGIWGLVKLALEQPMRAWYLRRMRMHEVVIGDGEIAEAMAECIADQGRKVVRVSRSIPGAKLPQREFVTVAGDGPSARGMENVRIEHAARVLLVDQEDNNNLYWIGRLKDSGPRSGAVPFPCFEVHVHDPVLRQLYDQQRPRTDRGSNHFELFNLFESAARRLVVQYPLDRRHVGTRSSLRVHLTVLGFGRMGQSLVRQALMQGHYANGPISITIVDEQAARLKEVFSERYPELGRWASIDFVQAHSDSPAATQHLLKGIRDKGAIETTALCLPDDAGNALMAFKLLPDLRQHDGRAWIRIARQEGLRTLLSAENNPKDGNPVVVFGDITELCRDFLVESESSAVRARAVHDDFLERRVARDGDAVQSSRRIWDALDPEFRRSNREQIDHIPVKLRALGCEIVDRGRALQRLTTFEPEEIELLSRMEHARWMFERALAGWRPTDGKKDESLRLSPYLVPWEQLDEQVREWDREAVRNIPKLVEMDGHEIRR